MFLFGAEAAAITPNGISTLFVKGLSTFFINGRLAFSNGPRSLPRNPPDCIILDIFDNFESFNELFPKALRRLVTCLSVNNKLCGELVASVPVTPDDNLRVIPFAFFAADLNSSS